MNYTLSVKYLFRGGIFIISLFFIALSFWLDNKVYSGINKNDINRVERSLNKLHSDAYGIVNKAFGHNEFEPDFDSEWPEHMSDKGVSLYLMQKTIPEPIYWSNNLPATSELFSKIGSETQYINLGNGWYTASTYEFGQYKAIVFVLIKTEYLYQNKFLKNGFNKSLNFPNNATVSPLGSDFGFTVHSMLGKPLFTVNSDIVAAKSYDLSLPVRWLAVLMLLILIVNIFSDKAFSLWRIPLSLLTLLLSRFLIEHFAQYFKGDLFLFSPMLYAESAILPSLGDLLVNVIFMLCFSLVLYKSKGSIQKIANKLSSAINTAWFVVSSVFIALYACFVHYSIISLVINSGISYELYKLDNITIYTFVAYAIIVTMFVALYVLLITETSFGNVSKLKTILIQGFIFVAVFVFLIKPRSYTDFIFVCLFIFMMYMAGLYNPALKMKLNRFVFLISIMAIYISGVLIINIKERESEKMLLRAHSLSTERDPVAEMLLGDVENKIKNDPYLNESELANDEFNIYARLADEYFRGYFQRYDLRCVVCDRHSVLNMADSEEKPNCFEFFNNVQKAGLAITGCNNFMFMNNYWGRIHYFGRIAIPMKQSDSLVLFIELFSKPDIEAIGYPELLKAEDQTSTDKAYYSYAKYSYNKLVAHYGDYEYGYELKPENIDERGFYTDGGFKHCVYHADSYNSVIISVPAIKIYDLASMFSYTFLILFIFTPLLFWFYGITFNINHKRLSYRWRISAVMLTAIIVALTVLAASMLAYTTKQSEAKNIDGIKEKMQSIVIEMDQSIYGRENRLDEIKNDLTSLLIGLSNSFYTDLNLYGLDGDLIASSRSEIFEKRLTGTIMNRKAYKNLSINKAPRFVHTEKIGSMTYYSAYTTYYNRDGEPVAYINLPHFFKQSDFRNELVALTGAIINIYIFVILIGFILSLFVSNQITRPLDEVRLKMARLDLLKQPEPISYKGNNELGDLVREYNRMINELSISAKILAENERESAWREMARQIAHEIKNPLTPMKLSIQLALHMKEQKREGWQDKMDEAVNSVLNQIEVLSQTASEFSDIARMGGSVSNVNLKDIISSSIQLFSGYDTCIEFNSHVRDAFVKANKEQLQRVFTNLIKNSLQALEKTDNGLIVLDLRENDGYYVVTITDNGDGIAEEKQNNLFRPDFTTKTGGSGLGLAISKSVCESFGGAIAFIPYDKGAIFEVRLPVAI